MRRGLARLLAVPVLLVPALAAPALAARGPAAPGAAAPSPGVTAAVDDEAPAQVTITRLAPRAPLDPAAFFQVSGRITNRGSQELGALRVRLRRGGVLRFRSELAGADADPPLTPLRIGTPVAAGQDRLAPGQSTTFDLRIRVGLLEMQALGVYPLKVEVRAVVGAEAGAGVVGAVQTYVPWFPDGAPRGRLRVAWLWPLTAEPTRGPREVMVDDRLAEQLRTQGRLDRMLRAAADGQTGRCDDRAQGPPGARPPPATPPGACRGEPVPVTYAVDPDLLFSADAMTSPYLVRATADRSRRVTDTAPARRWLATLRAALTAGTGAELLALPYADPDVVALTAPDAGLADEVGQLRALGRREAERVTGQAPLTSVVWPPGGPLTRRALEALTSGGATAAVVDAAALAAPGAPSPRTPTPDAAVGLLGQQTGVPVSALVADPALSALLDPDLPDYPGARVVEQRWLAETALLAAEAPSLARTVLVAPPRRSDLVAAVASAALLDSGRLPWLCPVPLTAVAAGTPACPGADPPAPRRLGPVELERPGSDTALLAPDQLAEVGRLRRRSAQLTDEVLDPTSPEAVRTTARLLRARARTESSAWRDDPAAGRRMLRLLEDDLADLRSKVHLQVGRGTVTLTSSSGVISVNVVNELAQPVRVGVELSSPGARLSTSRTPVEAVPAGFAKQISLQVSSATSGKFAVRAQLVDSSRRPFGEPVDLVVRSTQYGRVALAVTGLAAAVLLVAAGLRIVRRATRRPPP